MAAPSALEASGWCWKSPLKPYRVNPYFSARQKLLEKVVGKMAASQQGRPNLTSTLKNNKLSTPSERGTFQPGAASFIDSERVAASGCHQNTAWSAIINHIYYEGDVFGHDFRVDLFSGALLKGAPPRLDTSTFTLMTHNPGPHETSAEDKRSPDWHLVSMPVADTAWRTVSVRLMSGGDPAQYQVGKVYHGLTTQMKALQKRLHIQQVWRICLRFQVEEMPQGQGSFR
ncbi:hypothetical protein CDD82_5476 [Ophiocordyceps australis]|uniref:Uncharacterized protein n=1 Tax=Ophiocordyceps australis TaxID=1399860 RepID=A0A2C5Z263_9HYPO|nr:hypothetical protein CDD82_5476 [Ophiocordyceps australis]